MNIEQREFYRQMIDRVSEADWPKFAHALHDALADLIPYDDEPITESDRNAIEEAEKEYAARETLSLSDVFGDSDGV